MVDVPLFKALQTIATSPPLPHGFQYILGLVRRPTTLLSHRIERVAKAVLLIFKNNAETNRLIGTREISAEAVELPVAKFELVFLFEN